MIGKNIKFQNQNVNMENEKQETEKYEKSEI